VVFPAILKGSLDWEILRGWYIEDVSGVASLKVVFTALVGEDYEIQFNIQMGRSGLDGLISINKGGCL
jgi:hypothetical protein